MVIPAFNEAGAIGRVVLGARAFGMVVVADDASTDATASVARDNGAEVVTLAQNGGYDRALDAGARRARELGCSAFITMDADGQHDPALIPVFLERIRDGADVVVGVRDRFQRVSEYAFAMFGRVLWNIRDPMCGMKCYRMSVYDDLGHFDCYGSVGTELAIHAARAGRALANVPILTRPRAGASRFGAGWRANKRIFRALARGLGRKHSSARKVSG